MKRVNGSVRPSVGGIASPAAEWRSGVVVNAIRIRYCLLPMPELLV